MNQSVNSEQACSQVNRDVHTSSKPVKDRNAYFAEYRRKERLAKADPTSQLMGRLKVILRSNAHEYEPRLEKILDKWEGELSEKVSRRQASSSGGR